MSPPPVQPAEDKVTEAYESDEYDEEDNNSGAEDGDDYQEEDGVDDAEDDDEEGPQKGKVSPHRGPYPSTSSKRSLTVFYNNRIHPSQSLTEHLLLDVRDQLYLPPCLRLIPTLLIAE